MRMGTRRSAASSKTGASRSSFRRKRCARGWSLIPRAPASRQRRASSIGSAERSRRTNGMSSPCERSAAASVRSFGGAEGRLPVGLVHAERERPLDAVAAEEGDELLVGRREAVDVAADVDVCVEQFHVLRQQAPKLLVVRRRPGCARVREPRPRSLNLPAARRSMTAGARRPHLRGYRPLARAPARGAGARCPTRSSTLERNGSRWAFVGSLELPRHARGRRASSRCRSRSSGSTS